MTLLWPAVLQHHGRRRRFRASSSLLQNCGFRSSEFLLQWWPILLLWICGWICWRDLSFGLRWIMFVVPIMLIGVEYVTIESRYNTIEKMWGYTWAAGLVALFPFVATRARSSSSGW